MASRHPTIDSDDVSEDMNVEHVGPRTAGRRRFLGYLLAAPTVAAAASVGSGLFGSSDGGSILGPPAANALPGNPQVADIVDLEDALTYAAMPTANLIGVQMGKDGIARFALPRTEVGQGITTAISMLIAEELDLPLEKVEVTLADARPELIWNQLTGGSNTMNSMYTCTRVAAAVMKGKLMDVASAEFGDLVTTLTSKGGSILSPAGQKLTYADLAEKAASMQTKQVSAQLKEESAFTIIGKPTRRVDALDIVTGRKQFTMDIQVPNAMPTMICRSPTINGSVKSVQNLDAVKKMPGITDVATIASGVAVRGSTFGQCIDAVRALKVTWTAGTVDNESDDSVRNELKAAALPELIPGVPVLAKTVDAEYTFAFASNGPLEPGTAIADVRKDSAEIWTSAKVPITAQFEIAQAIGMPQSAVKLHVTQGGGSFGRRLFHDPATDAAEASKAFGKPVKLMWHRTDEFRAGRVHPMSHSRLRANVVGKDIVSFEQHHASVRTDYSHGFGEALTSTASRLPLGGLAVSEIIFETTAMVPYSTGVTKQLLVETHTDSSDNQVRGGFNTSSMRNVYSPNVVTAHELFFDKLAAAIGMDPYEFRHNYAKDDKIRTVVDKAAQVGGWNTNLPPGIGQGFGVHCEYKNVMCCFVEIDCRPETVNRKVRDGVTGPRVTKAVFVAIPGGIVVNPLGLEAQWQGGVMDGIALAMTSSLHLTNGYYQEGSWDDYFYTRQWNCPAEVQIEILPADKANKVGGGGECAVGPTMAATTCAWARAMGTQPDIIPPRHNGPLGFEPNPTTPPIPQSPTDGLNYAY